MNDFLPSSSFSTSEINFSLKYLDNYKINCIEDGYAIFNIYKSLIIEYLSFAINHLKLKNNNYIKFIFIRGFNTLSHVFQLILYYSKNPEMAIFHSQKSFRLYIEFIGQISDEEHSFLQLTSKEAVLYVYKNSIFEINNEILQTIKNNNNIDSDYWAIINENLHNYVIICKIIIQNVFKNIDFLDEDAKTEFIQHIPFIEDILHKLLLQKCKTKLDKQSLEITRNYICNLENTFSNNKDYLIAIESFIKK